MSTRRSERQRIKDAGLSDVPARQGSRRRQSRRPSTPGWKNSAAAARLSERSGTFDDFLGALKKRHDDFHAAAAVLSDHGLEMALSEPCTHAQAKAIFDAARAGRVPRRGTRCSYGSFLMLEFGRWDAARGWTKQLHLGATAQQQHPAAQHTLGPDTGFDSIGDFPQARALSRYLDTLDSTDQLPRIVLYNVNPADNYVFGTMIGNFQDGSIPGKIQFGSGWWFLDQKEGMEWQMNALSNLGLLSRFVGMLTDSRSFLCLSAPRVFPPHSLQYTWHRYDQWTGPSRSGHARLHGKRNLFYQRSRLLPSGNRSVLFELNQRISRVRRSSPLLRWDCGWAFAQPFPKFVYASDHCRP